MMGSDLIVSTTPYMVMDLQGILLLHSYTPIKFEIILLNYYFYLSHIYKHFYL